jgi:hypothetical protein
MASLCHTGCCYSHPLSFLEAHLLLCLLFPDPITHRVIMQMMMLPVIQLCAFVACVAFPILNLCIAITHRVRADGGTTAPTPACPQDCSGAGTCTAPTWATPQGQLSAPQYSCICKSSRAGPMCQGLLMSELVIQNTTNTNQGPVAIPPGTWQYFSLKLDSGLAAAL